MIVLNAKGLLAVTDSPFPERYRREQSNIPQRTHRLLISVRDRGNGGQHDRLRVSSDTVLEKPSQHRIPGTQFGGFCTVPSVGVMGLTRVVIVMEPCARVLHNELLNHMRWSGCVNLLQL